MGKPNKLQEYMEELEVSIQEERRAIQARIEWVEVKEKLLDEMIRFNEKENNDGTKKTTSKL